MWGADGFHDICKTLGEFFAVLRMFLVCERLVVNSLPMRIQLTYISIGLFAISLVPIYAGQRAVYLHSFNFLVADENPLPPVFQNDSTAYRVVKAVPASRNTRSDPYVSRERLQERNSLTRIQSTVHIHGVDCNLISSCLCTSKGRLLRPFHF